MTSASIHAQVIETFDYATGAMNNNGLGGAVVGDGGTGFDTNWFGNSGLSFDNVGLNIVAKSWSTPTNYGHTPSGNAIQATSNSNVAYRGIGTGVDFGANGVTYFSFLFNDSTGGNFNFGLGDSTAGSNTAAGPYLGIQIGSGASGQGVQGVSGTNGSAKASNFFGESQYTASQDYLIVGKILTFADTGSFDTIAFNIYGLSGAPSGATVALSDPGVAGNFTYAYGAAGMSGTADRITFAASNLGNDFSGIQGSSIIVDELRIGDSWESVIVPEPSAYAMLCGALSLGWVVGRRRDRNS